MTTLYVFVLTAFISFAGSIHIGPVNLMVIRTSLNRDLKSALLVGLGGSLPEIIYALVAIVGVSYLNAHPDFIKALNYMVIPFFLLLGVFYLLKKQNHKTIAEEKPEKSFSKGILLAILNPQLLPFWFGVLIYINSIFLINTTGTQLAFITGTAFGAFILLSIYAFIANRKRGAINQYLARFNFDKMMGWSFVGLGVMKIVSFV